MSKNPEEQVVGGSTPSPVRRRRRRGRRGGHSERTLVEVATNFTAYLQRLVDGELAYSVEKLIERVAGIAGRFPHGFLSYLENVVLKSMVQTGQMTHAGVLERVIASVKRTDVPDLDRSRANLAFFLDAAADLIRFYERRYLPIQRIRPKGRVLPREAAVVVVQGEFASHMREPAKAHAASYRRVVVDAGNLVTAKAINQAQIIQAKDAAIEAACAAYQALYLTVVKQSRLWCRSRTVQSFAATMQAVMRAYNRFFSAIQVPLKNWLDHNFSYFLGDRISKYGNRCLKAVEWFTCELAMKVKQSQPETNGVSVHLARFMIPALKNIRRTVLQKRGKKHLFEALYTSVFIQLLRAERKNVHNRMDDDLAELTQHFKVDALVPREEKLDVDAIQDKLRRIDRLFMAGVHALISPDRNIPLIIVLSIVPIFLLLLIPLTINYKNVTRKREQHWRQTKEAFQQKLNDGKIKATDVMSDLFHPMRDAMLDSDRKRNPLARHRLCFWSKKQTESQRLFDRSFRCATRVTAVVA